MELVKYSAPEWLTDSELVELETVDHPRMAVQVKLAELLTTPFISNRRYWQGIQPKRPVSDRLGPFLRVAFWNIARGERLDEILLALTGGAQFLQRMERGGVRRGSKGYQQTTEALTLLEAVDVLALNEVDLGLERSGYRDIVQELAGALGMNYAFGVEFIELAPLRLYSWEAEDSAKTNDGQAYRGLHGNAILSRYPIRSARIFQFTHQGFDWYIQEKQTFSFLDTLDRERRAASPIVQAMSFRQLRRGGRMALIAELDVPDVVEGTVTIVVTHLESRCRPTARRRQMRELLEHIRGVTHPVILAGDLNTSGRDSTPGRIHRDLLKLTASGPFWSWLAPRVKPGLGWLNDFVKGAPHGWAVERDPTCRGFLAANQERSLFDEIEQFRFDDGGRFDFRGDRERSMNQSMGPLANSNERTRMGFVPTSGAGWALGPIGRAKLDWILVKPYLRAPQDLPTTYRFAPHFGRTLRGLDDLSDHRPILVDLPFEEP
ncbi:MAG: endonuclease/exonuclease/phosphatase family protein [Acidobacteria bacterium]|nr:endonuclease/exonuclease/phosphatase family protein [Acidobacteriota bacterium]